VKLPYDEMKEKFKEDYEIRFNIEKHENN